MQKFFQLIFYLLILFLASSLPVFAFGLALNEREFSILLFQFALWASLTFIIVLGLILSLIKNRGIKNILIFSVSLLTSSIPFVGDFLNLTILPFLVWEIVFGVLIILSMWMFWKNWPRAFVYSLAIVFLGLGMLAFLLNLY